MTHRRANYLFDFKNQPKFDQRKVKGAERNMANKINRDTG